MAAAGPKVMNGFDVLFHVFFRQWTQLIEVSNGFPALVGLVPEVEMNNAWTRLQRV
jgi:hypothetical protein